ncbi:antibiotic biosynthesis monooxygenase [Deinococcus radiopugnans]|uniref:Antibiotic biosynthesis monooxygenase n=1 Tax=Deinococcus radiopugnans TaxID=57497 RepID=A0A0A7KGV0_9DEIO|nr:antibiotic biosynthesis monooxygenase [Deinococcus radiopugnans]AIZ45356.1 antibiotic biosynthesis monooxygenase [Deinococcus radiopugnans]
MITVANRMYVSPKYREQFEQRFRQRAGLVDGMPGFLANHVLRPTKEGEPYVVLTFWDSRDAFEAWTSSDAFRQGHARSGALPKEAFNGPGGLEVHEVLEFGAG